jgi:hypothetical protein
MRLLGTCASRKFALFSLVCAKWLNIPVSTGPGPTMLTRTPLPASSIAADFVMPSTGCLLPTYLGDCWPGSGRTAFAFCRSQHRFRAQRPLFSCGANKYCTMETPGLESSAREFLRISCHCDSLCPLFSKRTNHFDTLRNFFLLCCKLRPLRSQPLPDFALNVQFFTNGGVTPM